MINQYKKDLIEVCHRIYAKGWVANHDGNGTIKIKTREFLATPTSESKGYLNQEILITVDETGKVISGIRKVFSEINLHMKLYAERSDINAVLHAHPPFATAFAVCGIELDKPIIAEAILSLGDRIPLIPFAMPGSKESQDVLIEPFRKYNAAILENHGVIAVGKDIFEAFYRMELVEHIAKMQYLARSIGKPQYLDESVINPLMKKRHAAGLDPTSQKTKMENADEGLKQIIREEVLRHLHLKEN